MIDTAAREAQFSASWGDPAIIEALATRHHRSMPAFHVIPSFALDEPICLERLGPLLGPDWRHIWEGSEIIRYVRSVGLDDFVAANILRDRHTVGSFVLTLRSSHGPARPEDLDYIARISPHVRRAATIGNLLQMQTLQVSRLEAALDALAPGVVQVDASARILHANAAAGAMLSSGVLRSMADRLHAPNARADADLAAAIGTAARAEAQMAGSGIGAALSGPNDPPLVGHVLPLRRRSDLGGLAAQAEAAVFIASDRAPVRPDLAALAQSFGLTPAETRIACAIPEGMDRPAAARALDISPATVKSHLERLFQKTGVSDQRALQRLASALALPVADQGLSPPLSPLSPVAALPLPVPPNPRPGGVTPSMPPSGKGTV